MHDHLDRLHQFRQALYQSFPYRRDSLLDLLDALSSNERARSPVELCLNPLFRRQYSAIYRAIEASYCESDYPVCSLEAYRQGQLIISNLPLPQQHRYQVFGIDEPPNVRRYARCLSDRQTVHQSTPVPAQLPISVGHNYSILAAMPETAATDWPRWALPVLVERVSSLSNAIDVAHNQIAQLLSYPQTQRFTLNVMTVDSRYPTPAFLHELYQYRQMVVVARMRSNRVLYCQPIPGSSKTRPRWYGERFGLNEQSTWPPSNEEQTLNITTASGRTQTLRLRRWSNVLMRGKRNYPMHQYPFELVQVQRLDEATNRQTRPLWLLVWGQQRLSLLLADVFNAYRQRFNLEHFLGFAKPHLLLTASQSCSTAHESNWVRLSSLAQVQLWLARAVVDTVPLPWQRYAPTATLQQRTPRAIQRGFGQLIRQMGTLAAAPKPRGMALRVLIRTL